MMKFGWLAAGSEGGEAQASKQAAATDRRDERESFMVWPATGAEQRGPRSKRGYNARDSQWAGTILKPHESLPATV